MLYFLCALIRALVPAPGLRTYLGFGTRSTLKLRFWIGAYAGAGAARANVRRVRRKKACSKEGIVNARRVLPFPRQVVSLKIGSDNSNVSA
jgi:hypothetical protein